MDALSLVLGAAAGIAVGGLWLRLRTRGRRARREAEGARNAREAFFHLAAHELRSPLSAILGYQELLEDGAYGPFPEEAQGAVVRLGVSARHLLHLTDGVLELSRLRAGEVQPRLAPMDLGLVLSAAADAFRTLGGDRRLEVTVKLPPELPVVRSDQDRLVQALNLLITSAVRHPRDRSMTMEVSRDDGVLAVALHPLSLKPDPDILDPELTMGIRLSVTRELAVLLGGDLTLIPPEGNAHTLRFRIPAPEL